MGEQSLRTCWFDPDPSQKAVKGMVQSALSGEGFVCRSRGPGTIYIQSRQLPGFARQLIPFLPKPSSGG